MKVFSIIEKILFYICSFLLMTMLIITTWQVFTRYIFGHVFVWSEELARYASISVTLLGASIAVRTSDHVVVDLLSEFINENSVMKKILFFLQETACVIFYILIIVSTVQILPSTAKQISPGLTISMVVPYSSLIIGSAMALLFNIEKIYLFVKKMIKK